MPARYRTKNFLAGGTYHIFNQGIDKRVVFADDQDYRMFMDLFKNYLAPSLDLEELDNNSRYLKTERPYRHRHRIAMNLQTEVSLLAFCLMPTNFDLLVRQSSPDGITKLMRRLVTSYVTYFNRKNNRAGNLFEGVYKAKFMDNEHQMYSTLETIHHKPISVKRVGLISTTSGSPEDYPYSSYHIYLGDPTPTWLDKVGLVAQ